MEDTVPIPPQKKFESLDDFSKKVQLTERQQAAETIRQYRKEYFTKQEETRNKLEGIVAAAEAKKLTTEEVRKSIEDIEEAIEQSSKNFIRRLLDRKKLKRLETELGIAKTNEDTIAEELAELEAAKLEAENALQDRTALGKARNELDAFYQKTEQSWNEYEEDREVGNVKNIMRIRNAFLVHAFINPTLSPSDENGLMRNDLSWRDKLDLLVLEPTLSASAVNKDHKKTFAPLGVLLADGQVERASIHDIGSRSLDLKNRDFRKSYPHQRIGEQIDEALEPKTQHGWTEFVVSEPKVGGLFFGVESDGKLSDITFGSDANMLDIVNFSKERGLPLFALRDGEFYCITAEEALVLAEPTKTETTERVGLNTYTRTNIEHQKLDLPQDRLLTGEKGAELPECINEEQKEAILERFMTDSPFQLRRVPEALQIASRADGQSLYHLYNRQKVFETSDKEKRIIPRNSTGNVEPIKVTILDTILGPTHLQHSVLLEDGTNAIWYESRKPVSDESRFIAGSTYRQDWLMTKQSSINVGQGYVRTEKAAESVADIINAVQSEIKMLVEWIQKWEKDGMSRYVEQNRDRLKNITFSLYGMSEEAKKVGDEATVELVQNTVREFLSEEEYQAVIAKRVSEAGTIKLTREELIGNK